MDMSGTVRETSCLQSGIVNCCWQKWQAVQLLHTDCKQTFQRTCSEKVDCVNAFRMGRSTSSFITKSCTFAHVVFLTGIIPYSLDSIFIFLCTFSRHSSIPKSPILINFWVVLNGKYNNPLQISPALSRHWVVDLHIIIIIIIIMFLKG